VIARVGNLAAFRFSARHQPHIADFGRRTMISQRDPQSVCHLIYRFHMISDIQRFPIVCDKLAQIVPDS
jgi:hypothetical protein